jgi:hypothetical protein
MLRCNGATCERAAPGSEGGACYGNGSCDFGLRCNTNVCEPLFNSSSSSSGGASSSSGGTPTQGTEGGACYPNNTCNLGLDCTGGTCQGRATGSLNGPCYGNGTCNSGLECTNNVCVNPPPPPQGSLGGACYGNGTCNSGLSCSNNLCIPAVVDAGMGGTDAGNPNVGAPTFLGDSCDPAFHQAACGALANGAQCLGLTTGGGICLKPGCNATAPCGSGNVCADFGETDYCAAQCNPTFSDGGVANQVCGAGQGCVNVNDAVTNTISAVCLSLDLADCRYDQNPTGCTPGFECTPVGTDGYGQCTSGITRGGSCDPANAAPCTSAVPGAECVAFNSAPDVGWCVSMGCTVNQACAGAGTLCLAGGGTDTFCTSTCDAAGQCGAGAACVNFGASVCFPLGLAGCRTDLVPSGCAANEGCVATGTDGYGDCFPGCDVFAANNGCPQAGGCYPVSQTGGVCLTAGNVALNQACTFSDECQNGLACSLLTASCRQMCDATHPCPGGSGTCQFNLFSPTIGVCE